MSATVLLIIKGTSADNYLNNTAASPLYYVRGGKVSLYLGSLRYAGLHSLYWSSTIYPSATGVYDSMLYGANVHPSSHHDRLYGLLVRCIAQ